jgi:hypothetical protein
LPIALPIALRFDSAVERRDSNAQLLTADFTSFVKPARGEIRGSQNPNI